MEALISKYTRDIRHQPILSRDIANGIMKKEDSIYRDLQRHLDRLPIGFPNTDSGVEIRILRHLFSPKEAEVALQLSMIPEPINKIYNRVRDTGMSLDELRDILDTMVKKGSLEISNEDSEFLYCNAMLVLGMFEFQVERLTREFVNDIIQYRDEAFGKEMYRTKVPQMRTIPVQKSILTLGKHFFGSYDDAKELVNRNSNEITVANCVCRQAKDIIGEPCRKTSIRESCILFSGTARYYLNIGLGRAITKEAALEILNEAQSAGLVIQPQNTQNPEFICCCCGDCCEIITTVKRFPRPAELYASNFYAVVKPELCNGCGTCVDFCQLEALSMVGEIADIDLGRCIGCGNCVQACGLVGIILHKKPKELVPPKNAASLYTKILSKKSGRFSLLKVAVKKSMGRQI